MTYTTFEQRLNEMSNSELLSFNENIDLCERMILNYVLWTRGLRN